MHDPIVQYLNERTRGIGRTYALPAILRPPLTHGGRDTFGQWRTAATIDDDPVTPGLQGGDDEVGIPKVFGTRVGMRSTNSEESTSSGRGHTEAAEAVEDEASVHNDSQRLRHIGVASLH